MGICLEHTIRNLLTEAIKPAKVKPYYVSVNYEKGASGSKEHAVGHYQINHPSTSGVSPTYYGSQASREIKKNVDHQKLAGQGFKVANLHASEDKDVVHKDAMAHHEHAIAVNAMIRKQNPVKEEIVEEGKDPVTKQVDKSENNNKPSVEFKPRISANKLHRNMQIKTKIIDEEEQVEEGIKAKLGLQRKSLGDDMQRFKFKYRDPRLTKQDTNDNRKIDSSSDKDAVDRMQGKWGYKVTKGSPAELQGRLSKKYLDKQKSVKEEVTARAIKKLKGKDKIEINPKTKKPNKDTLETDISTSG